MTVIWVAIGKIDHDVHVKKKNDFVNRGTEVTIMMKLKSGLQESQKLESWTFRDAKAHNCEKERDLGIIMVFEWKAIPTYSRKALGQQQQMTLADSWKAPNTEILSSCVSLCNYIFRIEE